jgi:hypothetical protein
MGNHRHTAAVTSGLSRCAVGWSPPGLALREATSDAWGLRQAEQATVIALSSLAEYNILAGYFSTLFK